MYGILPARPRPCGQNIQEIHLMPMHFFRRPFFLTLSLVLFFTPGPVTAAAAGFPSRNATAVTQPQHSDPAYIQYLESKSLLGSSHDLARIVSGSRIMWHAPATDPTPETLLQAAPNWLSIHPVSLLTRKREPVFAHLANPVFWSILGKLGLQGLYLAPASGTGALWTPARIRTTRWQGMVQFAFTDDVGDDRDYGMLLTRANQGNFFLGLEMMQGAGGLGPDFFLGARGNPEYSRLYRMIEIPEQFWKNLPAASEEWDCKPLSAEQTRALRAAGALPPGEDEHNALCPAPWGWAVTGRVLAGSKGTAKRFAYRWFQSPQRPILDWDDPQAGARRILSACAIRRIGTQGAALLGIQTQALNGIAPEARRGTMEPALSAAVSIGREVRRYGAWTWLEDELPLAQLQDFLRQGPDFALDSVTAPGAEHALLTGDAQLLRFMYDEARRIELDQRRLVRRLPDEHGLSYALPHLCAGPKEGNLSPSFILKEAKQRGGAWAGTTLYAGSAGLAALALDENASGSALEAEIRRGHSLLIFFKAMQPGIFMLPARDLAATLPLDGRQGRKQAPGNEPALAAHGAYALLSTADDAPAGKAGLPRAPALFLPLDVQGMRPANENFLKTVEEILRVRKQSGMAGARFLKRLNTKHSGSIALLFALPGDRGALLSVYNFSRTRCSETLDLDTPEIRTFLAEGGAHSLWGPPLNGSTVSLGPWQGAAVLLGKTPPSNVPPPPPPLPARDSEQTAPTSDAAATPARTPPGGDTQREHRHRTAPGESLSKIAARYGVGIKALMRRNGITSPDRIREGRTLIIPAP